MTRIIQISDTHIVPHGQLAYGQVDTAAALADCVDTINRNLPVIGPVDMVFVAGDLTDFGSAEEYQRFRALMEPLDLPYRAIPGNHDNIDVMRACFADQSWMPTDGPINWNVHFDDVVLIGLDSSVSEAAHGHLNDATLLYLTTVLNTLNGKPTIVTIHHPPILTGIEKMDIQNLRESLSDNRRKWHAEAGAKHADAAAAVLRGSGAMGAAFARQEALARSKRTIAACHEQCVTTMTRLDELEFRMGTPRADGNGTHLSSMKRSLVAKGLATVAKQLITLRGDVYRERDAAFEHGAAAMGLPVRGPCRPPRRAPARFPPSRAPGLRAR